MPKPTGRLRLGLVDVYGKPIKDRVTIKFDNVELKSAKRTLKDIDFKKVCIIDGLHQTPKGLYKLQIIPVSYRPYAQLVTVTSKMRTYTFTLHIRPAMAEPTFPSFARIRDQVNPQLADVLKRSPSVKDHFGQTGAALWKSLEAVQKAALLNIATKALAAPIRKGQGILPHVTLRRVLKDRCFANVPEKLVAAVEAAPKKAFTKVPDSLHEPPAEFESRSSFKTDDEFGNLQFTFFQKGDTFAADIDIDNSAGIRHVVDVVKHKLSGKGTHPYDIHEILVEHQGLDPGYSLAPRR